MDLDPAHWSNRTKIVVAVVGLLAAVLFMYAVSATTAGATWKDQYAHAPKATRDWYEAQTTTPETRKRLNANWYTSCCLHADTVKAHFVVDKTDGSDRWYYQIDGTTKWHQVPADTVQSDIKTPDDQPVLFVDATGRNFGPVCFFPGIGRY